MIKQYAFLSLVLAAGCYTYVQLKDMECKTFCKTSAGYVSGVFIRGQCWCADKVTAERIENKKIVLPKTKIINREE